MLNAVIIVLEPFAVAYGMGILDQALTVDNGAGTVDLCRLHRTLPEKEDQIALDEAGDYIEEKLSRRDNGAGLESAKEAKLFIMADLHASPDGILQAPCRGIRTTPGTSGDGPEEVTPPILTFRRIPDPLFMAGCTREGLAAFHRLPVLLQKLCFLSSRKFHHQATDSAKKQKKRFFSLTRL